MKTNYKNYGLLFRFIDTYLPSRFQGINRRDPLMVQLEEMMENNKQFFFIADVISLKILFTSKRSAQMMGTEPENMTPETFFEVRHPDEINRHTVFRAKIIKTANEIYNDGKGERLLSSCAKIRNNENNYVPTLAQCYFFYSEIPHKAVYMLEVYTEVNKYQKIVWEHHHYFGNDISNFRFPDEKLMKTGSIFSDRELEVIQLLAKGFNTKQISEKLFISPYTVNTHRSNILQKSGKANLQELISWLREIGML